MSVITMGNYVRSHLFFDPLPYMELIPDYLCTSPSHTSPYKCEPKDFCGKSDVNAKIDWNSDTSLHNWAVQLDLACKSDSEIGLIGTMYFVGVILSVTTLLRLSDLYGKKRAILFC